MSPKKVMRFHLPTVNFHGTFVSFLGVFSQSGNPAIPGDAYPNLSNTRWMAWVNLRSFVGKKFGVKYFMPRNIEPYNGLFHHFHPCLCRVIGPQFVKTGWYRGLLYIPGWDEMLGHDLDTGQPAGPVPCTPAFRQYHFGMGVQSWFLQASGTTCFKHHCGHFEWLLYLHVLFGHHRTFLIWSDNTFACLWSKPLALGNWVNFCLLLAGPQAQVWTPELGSGIRFREAKHPGPVCSDSRFQTIRFCITSPTSLAQKSDVRADLAKIHQRDVISLSETAAPEAAQKTFSKLVGKHQLRCHWSPPVPSFRNTITLKPRDKGKPSEVCLCSKLPFRPCRNIFDAKGIASTRIIHSIVKAGHLHIQVITIYCKPTSSVASVAFNQDLLNYVITRVDLLPLPFINMGDSNMDLDRFDCWPSLESKGCRCLPQMYRRLVGSSMPATCKDVTIQDNAIISSTWVPVLTRCRC